ncbi:hypothetical protein ACGFWI_00375 [Streptomyces sp. NPDC048434]|uniref:hypothetical protein n=1 Tax=Streptomyces sp. NPDC048434 TaxID=3365549 RepID=UPI0037180269
MAAGEIPDSPAEVPADVQRLIRRRLRAGLTASGLCGAEVEPLRWVTARPGSRVPAVARELRLAGNSVSTPANEEAERT